MGLVETLVVGSYVWSTMLGGWLWTQIHKLATNHLKHVEERLDKLEGK